MQYEYYSLLEIERTASTDEIKKAYRKKAMEYHPDRNAWDKEAEAKFKKINEAYATLSDPQKKAHYDRFWTSEGMWGFGWGFGGFGGGFDASDLGDIFWEFFGGGFGGASRRRRADIGEDIEIRMKISLEDAIKGTSRKIEFERTSICQTCNGKKWETTTCKHCGGTWSKRERVQTLFGVMEQSVVCPVCEWTGEEVVKACKTCNGKWKQQQKVEKTVEVPKGIDDGMSIKMRNEWHEWKDGNGDLYITFSVPNDEGGLRREWNNLVYRVKISPSEAALGIKKDFDIPIIGKKHIHLKEWTQPNEEIRFRWEWITNVTNWKVGDLIIQVEIIIPKKLTSDQKRLYEALLASEWKKQHKGWLEELFGG